jgi:hypothetical protein
MNEVYRPYMCDMIKQDESTRPLTEAHIVLGWAEELRRRAGR